MIINIYLLRFFAILLIINQHAGYFYPGNVYNFGGHLGNSIFFMISGVGLALSFAKKPLSFFDWIKQRYAKIILPIVFFTFIVCIGSLDLFFDRLIYFLVPHRFAQLDQFIPNLIVLYFFFYFINKMKISSMYILLIFILIFYYIYYSFIVDSHIVAKSDFISSPYFYWLSSSACFVLGVLIGRQFDDINTKFKGIIWMLILGVMFIFSIILHFVVKYYFSDLLFINYYINIISILLIFMSSLQINNILTNTLLIKFVHNLAILSLPVFIIHFTVINVLKSFIDPSYFALFLVFFVSFSLSYIFNIIYINLYNYYCKFFKIWISEFKLTDCG